jgi:hypothetical protein
MARVIAIAAKMCYNVPMDDKLAALGFKVIAVTPQGDGLSYDALYVGGKRRLVRGDVCATPEEAMENLYEKCA